MIASLAVTAGAGAVLAAAARLVLAPILADPIFRPYERSRGGPR